MVHNYNTQYCFLLSENGLNYIKLHQCQALGVANHLQCWWTKSTTEPPD